MCRLTAVQAGVCSLLNRAIQARQLRSRHRNHQSSKATCGALRLAVNVLNLLVRRAMGSDLHDVRLVLSQPGIDAQGVCRRTSVTDRDVVRG